MNTALITNPVDEGFYDTDNLLAILGSNDKSMLLGIKELNIADESGMTFISKKIEELSKVDTLGSRNLAKLIMKVQSKIILAWLPVDGLCPEVECKK